MVINPIVGIYIPIIRIPIKGGMTIPNIATFDHGTYNIYIYYIYTLIFPRILEFCWWQGYDGLSSTFISWIQISAKLDPSVWFKSAQRERIKRMEKLLEEYLVIM